MVLLMDPQSFANISHVLYFHSLVMMTGVSIVKISIAFCLVRLVSKQSHKMFLYGTIVFIVVLTITCALTLIFQCLPIRASWDASLRPPPFGTGNAKCYTTTTFRNIGMMNSSKAMPSPHDVQTVLIACSLQHRHRCAFCNSADPSHLEPTAQHPHQDFSHPHPITRMVCFHSRSHQGRQTIPRIR